MMPYMTHIFDCDGVLLDSNRIKETSFYSVACKYYSEETGQRVVAYHRTAGATGRTDRVRYMMMTADAYRTPALQHLTDAEIEAKLLEEVTALIKVRTFNARLIPGVYEYLAELHKTPGVESHVVSGVETEELKTLLKHFGILDFFETVQGTSDKARAIRLVMRDAPKPVIYYGDTWDDAKAAAAAGVDRFVFVYRYSTDPQLAAIPSFKPLVFEEVDSKPVEEDSHAG